MCKLSWADCLRQDETVVVAEVKRFSAGAIYSKIPPKYQENEPRPYDGNSVFPSTLSTVLCVERANN